MPKSDRNIKLKIRDFHNSGISEIIFFKENRTGLLIESVKEGLKNNRKYIQI